MKSRGPEFKKINKSQNLKKRKELGFRKDQSLNPELKTPNPDIRKKGPAPLIHWYDCQLFYFVCTK